MFQLPRFRRHRWPRPKEVTALLKETVVAWNDDNLPRLGAALAFYTLLSLAPLLIVVVAIAGIAYGKQAAQGQIFWQIRDLVGPDGARAIQGLLEGAYKPGTGALATGLGLLTLAFGASSVVGELREALNTIWRVPSESGGLGFASVVGLLKARIYSFAFVLGIGFLLLISLVLNAWLAVMGRFFGGLLPAPEWVLQAATSLISFLVITALFAAIYKLMPDVRLKWSDVMVGASFTGLLFTAGKYLIGLYLGKASFGSTYGAAGSLVIVLVWVYYSSQLFFLGAEFTKIYTEKFGSHLAEKLDLHAPKPESVIVDPKEVAQPANEGAHIIQ
ncbi:MAG: YihY/virulence factor BrkB family protein [Acidobacteriota bacterium]|nr:YihY/virulence factor BrkB family protein [Acidobacteriota bacterium]